MGYMIGKTLIWNYLAKNSTNIKPNLLFLVKFNFLDLAKFDLFTLAKTFDFVIIDRFSILSIISPVPPTTLTFFPHYH